MDLTTEQIPVNLLEAAKECADHIKDDGFNWEVALSFAVKKFGVDKEALKEKFPYYSGGKEESATKRIINSTLKKAMIKLGIKEDGPPQLKKADGMPANI